MDGAAQGIKTQNEKREVIGGAEIKLYLQQNGKVYLCAVKDDLTITRTPNEPSVLKCTILRDAITAENGNVLAFNLNGAHNQFYGYIFSTGKHGRYCDVVAYDQLIYMRKNKDTMTYSGITANELLLRIVDDYHLKTLNPPNIVNTEFKIPSRVEENVSLLDMMHKALQITYENTGKKYLLWDDYGAITLFRDTQMLIVSNRISMGFIQNYSYNQSIEDLYNRVKLYKENPGGNRDYFIAENKLNMSRYGFIQRFEKLEEGENGHAKANQLLNQASDSTTFSISGAQGDIRVRGGSLIYVDFFGPDMAEYIRGWFRTLSVTHSFSGGTHLMDLDLECVFMDTTGW